MPASVIALAGATGLLGTQMIQALIDAQHPVIVLTRKGSTSTSELPNSDLIRIKEVDYTDTSSLIPVLGGIDVVISTLAAVALGDQLNLVQAAYEAGVPRFIPSEFGSDTSNPANNALPVYAGKVNTANRLKELSKENPKFTYTLVYNQLFLDSGLKGGFIIHPATHSARVYDGGDSPISVTRLGTVAKATTAILDHLDETANRIVYIHDTVVTQNQLIGIVKGIDGQDWELSQVDTSKLRKESFAELKKEKPDYGKAMVGFLPGAIYGKDAGGDFSGKTDNKLLGIKEMTEEELRKLVKDIVEGGGWKRMW